MKKDKFIINQSRCDASGVFAVRLVALCVVLSGLFYCPDVSADDPNSRTAGSNIAAIASNEVVKRQQRVQQAQTLFTSGSKAYSDRSYGEAMDYFKAAYEITPEVPATAEMRRAFFKRYQRAALSFTEILISEAKWAEAEQTLGDVYNTAERGGIAKNTLDPGVRKTLERLKSKDYYNMANSPRHIENIAEVQRKLTLAKGYAELGAYDRALRAYNKVLAIDPYNRAARRGAEVVERHIMDYADAARNHTRAANLAQIAQGWEMPVRDLKVPDFIMSPDTDLPQAGRVILESKLKRIIIPSLEFNEAELGDVLEYLAQKAQELDVNEVDPLRRGLNIVIDAKGSGDDPAHKTLSVRISNVPLGTALKYVSQLVGMKYIVGDYAVSVVPLSAASDEGLMVRSFSVPPGFIQGGGAGADSGGGGDADPFAPTPDGGSGTLVVRIKAQEFLEQRGITFGPGAVANYNQGTLVVKNTADQIAIIERMVQDARDAGSKNVQVNVKMVSIGENELKQAGIDWLLGGGSFGGGGNTFFTGGTNGNSVLPAVAADYPFPIAGMNPVTSGLRTGTFSSNLSIDDVLVGATNSNGVAPGVFAVSGLTNPQFGMVIRALDQMKGSDLLCDAHVTVNPGQKAKIEQVREFIYPTEYDPPEIPNQVGGGGGRFIILPPPLPPIFIPDPPPFIPVTPATPTAFEMRKVGKVLEVEPIVSKDNKTISVNILADFVDFVGFVNYGTPINGPVVNGQPTILTENRILMPVFDVIRETTGVQVWDGNTIVIGGFHGELISETADKIPGIGDLPLVGSAFRSTTSERRKKALLIFVTIRLVDPGGNPLNAAIDELAAK